MLHRGAVATRAESEFAAEPKSKLKMNIGLKLCSRYGLYNLAQTYLEMGAKTDGGAYSRTSPLSFHDSYANWIWRMILPHIQASSGISLPASLILFSQLPVRVCAAPASPPVQTVRPQLMAHFQEFFITSLINILHWSCPVAFSAAIIAIARRYSTRDPVHVFRITSAIGAIASLAAGDGSTRPEARFSATVTGIALLLHYWAWLFPGTLTSKDIAWPTTILSAALGLDGLICHLIAPNQGVDPALFVQLLLISFWLSLTLLSGLRPMLRRTRETLLLSMNGGVPVTPLHSIHAA
jgi:hypothetical protein